MGEGSGFGQTPSAIVIASADVRCTSRLSTIVRDHGYFPLVANGVRAGLRALGLGTIALIMDVALPDGSATELIERARERRDSMPILVMGGPAETEFMNETGLIGVDFAFKPNVEPKVACFLDVRTTAPEFRARDIIADLRVMHDLTDAEARLALVALMTTSRRQLADLLGISSNTVKQHIGMLLAKTGAGSLEELVGPLRERVLRW
jgi:FixJ family two-component response regulator